MFRHHRRPEMARSTGPTIKPFSQYLQSAKAPALTAAAVGSDLPVEPRLRASITRRRRSRDATRDLCGPGQWRDGRRSLSFARPDDGALLPAPGLGDQDDGRSVDPGPYVKRPTKLAPDWSAPLWVGNIRLRI